ncbi:MAG: FAD-dependent oxidoreductase [Eubacteriales bacterium]|nr:FAD-dependent oxidoreductase [Eubacteriales bacterium]
MKKVLIIGSGISGLTCAIECAARGMHACLVSPYPSERSQSVMAAGGINAALDTLGEGDSPGQHAADTMKGGGEIASLRAVQGMCEEGPQIVRWLESIGTVFTRDEHGEIALRAMGGQSHRRTAFADASTGKQIVSALVRQARRYECSEWIERRLGLQFHSALIEDGVCCGALFYDELRRCMEPVRADAVVMATGGQNALFGKTTGSALCDGYAAGKLFCQGARLKNLEFIQYHPTTIETTQKKLLITEGARGEGGRLYYLQGDKRLYFMEKLYGLKGNLMPRDVVSKCIYDAPSQVYLDIAHLGRKHIAERLSEVASVCSEYAGIDVTKESIPVTPSVHFFMGGLDVDLEHRTNIENLYAIGECAAIYHGANRLGGNSLLAAIYSGRMAARSIEAREQKSASKATFAAYIEQQQRLLERRLESHSRFSAVFVKQELAKIMNEKLGITRTGERLREGIESVDYYLSIGEKLIFDSEISPYQGYTLVPMLRLARAVLLCAENRRETRGAHIREDHPERSEEYARASVISYADGKYELQLTEEK